MNRINSLTARLCNEDNHKSYIKLQISEEKDATHILLSGKCVNVIKTLLWWGNHLDKI